MIVKNINEDLLSTTLDPDWTIDRMAEKLLSTIASHEPLVWREANEVVLNADTISDRQSQRLIRPILACLAQKSAAEAGTAPNLYEGHLAFKRQDRGSPVWIIGEFQNTTGRACVALRRSNSPPPHHTSVDRHLAVAPGAVVQPDPFPPTNTSVR